MRPIAPSIRVMTVAAAATGVTTTAALAPVQPRFIYKLGNSIYVPLTSRCNSRTLPQLRGEGFALPTPVVTALCRVRDAELGNAKAKGEEDTPWYLDSYNIGDLPPKTKLPPPPFEAMASLPPLESGKREPRIDDLLKEIQYEFREANRNDQTAISSRPVIESIVISGEGEPMLRLEDTIELVRRIKSFADTLPSVSGQPPPAIRLTTNGLVAPSPATSVPQLLWDSGMSNISVGLMTWNANQYQDLVRPLLPDGETGFDAVCRFIQDAVSVDGDLGIEATAIDRPDVDKAKTEVLAASLGVTNPVRWRPYFP